MALFLSDNIHRGDEQPRSQGFCVRTRGETKKPWSGPVTWLQYIDIFDSYVLVKEWRDILSWTDMQVFETNKQPKDFSIDIIYV
jgi:hypothetical protein